MTSDLMRGALEWQLEQMRLELIETLKREGAEIPDSLRKSLLAGIDDTPPDLLPLLIPLHIGVGNEQASKVIE